MADEKIDVNLALKNAEGNKNQAGFLKDMIKERNKDEENAIFDSDVNKETPNVDFD